MKKYFVILSFESYDDYSQSYFIGNREITDDEFQKKGRELGDDVLEWFDNLPKNSKKKFKKNDLSNKWLRMMISWLESEGFEEAPSDVPEINIEYGTFPSNKQSN